MFGLSAFGHRRVPAINYPNATFTSANGINDFGEIVGRHDDSAVTRGFYALKE